MCDIFRRDLNEAQKAAAEAYGAHSRIRNYGLTWDEAAFNARPLSREKLAVEMGRMREFNEDLDPLRFRPQRFSGRIMMDARDLHQSLVFVPATAFSAMKRALSVLARDSCAAALHLLDATLRLGDVSAGGTYLLLLIS